MARDLELLGAPPEIVETWNAKPSVPTIELLPESRQAVELFLDSSTQWRVAGQSGVAIGLDYSAVAVVARARRIRLDGELLDDVRTMEAAALAAFSDSRRRR